jgi:acyl dehydratase
VKFTLDELLQAKSVDLGHGAWLDVPQDRINLFADATGDHQWIHVDVERAEEGPFGRTVAHGYLTLSLLPKLMSGLLEVDANSRVNYGSDKVRFTAPVPSGSRIRASATLLDARQKGSSVLCRTSVEVEIEGQERPALVGTFLSLIHM